MILMMRHVILVASLLKKIGTVLELRMDGLCDGMCHEDVKYVS